MNNNYENNIYNNNTDLALDNNNNDSNLESFNRNEVNSKSRFSSLIEDPKIEAFELTKQCREDQCAQKVDLGVGAYKDEKGKPWVLPAVRKAEQLIASDESLNKEYLPVLGLPSFTKAAVELVLGENSPAIANSQTFGVQTISGTGALKVAMDFLARNGYEHLYVSNPTWGNHNLMSRTAGFAVHSYKYYDPSTKKIDFDGLKQDLNEAPANSVVIFHACAHNPSGMDLSMNQWALLSDLVKAKRLFPIFDVAYQGFCSGDLDLDAAAIRYFVREGHELFVAQSFAKNMGLYNERVGNLTVVVKDDNSEETQEVIAKIKSQLTTVIRGNYSNPPAHGARIAATIMNTPSLNAEWRENLRMMASRMQKMRTMFHEKLVTELATPSNWDHITKAVGLFTLTGLNESQVQRLREENHVYMFKSGRINVSALTPDNITYVARAVSNVISYD